LGPDRASWAAYDPLELVRTAKERLPVLIDQGLADQFLKEQLRPELFQEAAQNAGQELILNLRPDYDHSYYFIASFIADHLRHFVSKLG
ncbi:alpha/beta hydrolase-fold protein, partial [Komagataeibacter rhaeticus]